MEATKVGNREFRAAMADDVTSSTPVAVTRHGQTIGYFIPTHGQTEADVASLKKASKTWDRLLAAKLVDVDAEEAEFTSARQHTNAPKKRSIKRHEPQSDHLRANIDAQYVVVLPFADRAFTGRRPLIVGMVPTGH